MVSSDCSRTQPSFSARKNAQGKKSLFLTVRSLASSPLTSATIPLDASEMVSCEFKWNTSGSVSDAAAVMIRSV